MLSIPEVFFRKTRAFLNTGKWMAHLLGLSSVPQDKRKKALVLIQIDALSRKQFERALKNGRLPFLKKLLRDEHYRLCTHYSGMPCGTAAVQAELFYGKKCAVPTFGFYDPQTKRLFKMFNPADAKEIESRIDKDNPPLLTGGSSYSNIYTGGAAEPHFCISDIQFIPIFKRARPIAFIVGVTLKLPSLIRAAFLLAAEIGLSVFDVFRGVMSGKDLWREIKFIPSRVGMSVLFREIIVMMVRTDIHRGLEIIHLNLMGYHEQSHHRGGTSRFAHWTLKGIDIAVKQIWKAANRAQDDYDLWIYSDHGQIDSVPYEKKFGETFNNTVRKIAKQQKIDIKYGRSHASFLNRLGIHLDKETAGISDTVDIPLTCGMGPLAQVYLFTDKQQERNEFAEKLFADGKVPLIFVPQKDGTVNAMSQTLGRFVLPRQADMLFSPKTPLYESLVEDFMKTCRHEYSGDIICCGFQGAGKECITFRIESGSHGGVIEEEYSGFFMAPANIINAGYVRPEDIRNAALRFLGRKTDDSDYAAYQREETDTIRIMTYNVHTCRGMDGRLSPMRIAKTIEQYNPDIVALQELDIGRKRSKHNDQARMIADILEMDHFFAPAIELDDEKYGDAILSRFPIRLVKADILPFDERNPGKEPRGALWVEADIRGKKLQIINTHLGLTSREREKQINYLLSKQWMGAIPEGRAAILCGDFNFTKRSKLYKSCTQRFKESGQTSKITATYGGKYPIVRLDHIFFTPDIKIKNTITANSKLAQISSDHRPVIAEFYL